MLVFLCRLFGTGVTSSCKKILIMLWEQWREGFVNASNAVGEMIESSVRRCFLVVNYL